MAALRKQGFLQVPILRLLALGCLFALALGLRLYSIDQPPLDFHPTRQYRSALIARGYYFEALKTAPAWKKDLANLNKQKQGILEPPIMEVVTSFAYRILGGEYLWVPRLLSTLFWLNGGIFLYLIAKKVVSAGAAMFSTAFYLLLPYGIAASRSFQPDPLMVMMLLISIFAILRYYDHPSTRRLGATATIASLAVFIKPVCLFLILGAFFSIAIYRQGVRKSLTSLTSLLFTAATLFLTVVFYGYGILKGGDLQGQAAGSFVPHLVTHPAFWGGWLRQIVEVIGGTYLIGALLGILMLRQGLPRALLVGLWSSYFVFGLVFTYHIHTLDYYQLQFIPVVALSLGPISALIMSYLSQTDNTPYRPAHVLGMLLLVGILSLMLVALNVVLNVHQAQEKVSAADFESRINMYQEIGEVVNHSASTLFWTPDYGHSLEYYGWLSGTQWPRRNELQAEKLLGEVQETSIQERFDALDAEISPEYFIVLPDSEWFREQKDLRDFLTDKFPILVENDDYIVFDLEKSN